MFGDSHRVLRKPTRLRPEFRVPQNRDDEVDNREPTSCVEERLKFRLSLRLTLAPDDGGNECARREERLHRDFRVVGSIIQCVRETDEERSRRELDDRRPHHRREWVVRLSLHEDDERPYEDGHTGEVNNDKGFFEKFHGCHNTLGVMAETFAFLGTGSMGGAILDGLVNGGGDIAVRSTTRSSTTVRAGVETRSTETDADANLWAVDGASVVVIGVKPAMVADVLREVADVVDPAALIISVAAGITTATMEAIVSNPVVRAMPNTPALIGKGVTGISAGSRATDVHLSRARSLFEVVGWVLELPETRIDALSTISGSGPAYVFHAMEQWTRAAVDLGFTESDARNLVEKTFAGATALQESTGVDPAELRRRVTSPNGTTERAIAVLDAAQLAVVYRAAAEAALARAQELARQLAE